MFDGLEKFPIIVVTGPQRSGTRVCARMIGYSLGHEIVDERDIHIDSLYALMIRIDKARQQGEKIVVQCPALSYAAHFLGQFADVCVVMMMRDKNDIRASEKRVGWKWGSLEKMHYPDEMRFWAIDTIKYEYWKVQKTRIKNAVEIWYEGLKDHPKWLDKEEREGFHALQTEVDEVVE